MGKPLATQIQQHNAPSTGVKDVKKRKRRSNKTVSRLEVESPTKEKRPLTPQIPACSCTVTSYGNHSYCKADESGQSTGGLLKKSLVTSRPNKLSEMETEDRTVTSSIEDDITSCVRSCSHRMFSNNNSDEVQYSDIGDGLKFLGSRQEVSLSSDDIENDEMHASVVDIVIAVINFKSVASRIYPKACFFVGSCFRQLRTCAEKCSPVVDHFYSATKELVCVVKNGILYELQNTRYQICCLSNNHVQQVTSWLTAVPVSKSTVDAICTYITSSTKITASNLLNNSSAWIATLKETTKRDANPFKGLFFDYKIENVLKFLYSLNIEEYCFFLFEIILQLGAIASEKIQFMVGKIHEVSWEVLVILSKAGVEFKVNGARYNDIYRLIEGRCVKVSNAIKTRFATISELTKHRCAEVAEPFSNLCLAVLESFIAHYRKAHDFLGSLCSHVHEPSRKLERSNPTLISYVYFIQYNLDQLKFQISTSDSYFSELCRKIHNTMATLVGYLKRIGISFWSHFDEIRSNSKVWLTSIIPAPITKAIVPFESPLSLAFLKFTQKEPSVSPKVVPEIEAETVLALACDAWVSCHSHPAYVQVRDFQATLKSRLQSILGLRVQQPSNDDLNEKTQT